MIKKLFNYIRQDMPLRRKLFLMLSLIVVIPAVITSVLFYNQFYRSTVTTVLDSRLSTVNTTGAKIETTISQIREISDGASDTDFLQRILTIDDEILLRASEGDSEISLDFLDTYKAILNSYLEESGVSSICIYCDEDTELLNRVGTQFTDQAFFQPLSQVEYSYWKTIMTISGQSRGLFPGYYLTGNERVNYGGLSYVHKINYSKSGEWKEAYVAVYRDEEIFEDLLLGDIGMEGEFACVIDSKNVIVTPYAENEDVSLYVVSYEDLDEAFPETGTFYSGNYGKEPVYVCRYDFNDVDWTMIWVIPQEAVAGESRETLLQALGIYAVLLLLGIIAGLWIVWTLLNRIDRLKVQMENVKSGRPAALEEETGKDEIGVLQDSYNYMVAEVNESVDREIKTQAEMNDLRIEILQAQIDPHFLYNTLDVLRGLSKLGETEKVEELVLALTRFYRLALNNGERFSTVERETQQAESYMEIMNIRFPDQISFVADIPDEILDYQMPVLVFQPILENSVIHGILETENHSGNVSLTGWRENDQLIFLISDDGVGMEEDMLLAIAEGENISKNGSNIGIRNTMRRLQLIYGEGKAFLEFQSTPGKGTDVKITLPAAAVKEDSP